MPVIEKNIDISKSFVTSQDFLNPNKPSLVHKCNVLQKPFLS